MSKKKKEKVLESIIEERIEAHKEAAREVEAEVGRFIEDQIESKIESKKKQKRAAILDSAFELFTTKGVSSTTIRDITKKAGVAKGTFYLYYEDKESVLGDLMRLHSSRLLVAACNGLEEMDQNKRAGMSVSDKFNFIVDYLIDSAAKDPALTKLVYKNLSWGLFDPDDDTKIKSSSDESELDFVSYISSMLDAEGIRLKEPRLLLFTLLQMIASTCYDALVFEQPVSLEEYRPYLHKCIRLLVEDAIIT